MPKTVLMVPKLDDRAVVKFMTDACTLVGAKNFRFQQMGAPSPMKLQVEEPGSEVSEIGSSKLYSLDHATLNLPSFDMSIHRGEVSQSSPFMDRLTINNDTKSGQDTVHIEGSTVQKLNDLIGKAFGIARMSGASIQDQKGAESLIASHQQMLLELERSATALHEQFAAARIQMEQEFTARRADLESEFERKKAESDQASDKIRTAVAEHEERVNDREKALDNRDHIHARRELRQQITQGIAARLGKAILPARTTAVGWTIFVLTLAGSVALAVVSFYSLLEFSALMDLAAKGATSAGGEVSDLSAWKEAQAQVSAGANWYLAVRGALAAIGAIAFLVYSISWLKGMYHDDVRSQKELERYSIDLNRASWAVETIMEAKKDGGSIPDILVAGVSKNLFETAGGSQAAGQSDGLTSLLRASARAKITTSGAEFEVNSRGANKLAKELEGGD